MIQPNPARNEVEVRSSHKMTRVEIYDPAGTLVLDRELESEKIHLNISSIPAGMYIVRVYHADGYLQVRRLVLMK